MKANEAPENMYIPQKIYLPYKDGKVIGILKETGVPFKSGVDGNIEYTRTDAFIEKSCELLVNCIEDFMARRMEIWDKECKKQTLENLRKALKE